MTILAYIYANAMKVYQEAQGLQEVYDSARLLNRDFRDAFSSVVPVPGCWINPTLKNFPGAVDATNATIDSNYVDAGAFSAGTTAVWWDTKCVRPTVMVNNTAYDYLFSMSQRPPSTANYSDTRSPYYEMLGYPRSYWKDSNGAESPSNMASARWWATNTPATYAGGWGWWMPAFFGKRDGATAAIMESKDIMAGSWGWPRADYRMDADIDRAGAQNVACWFYSEYKAYNSQCTLALDNSNIVLTSIKFSRRELFGKIETQVSFLRHQIVGFDNPTLEQVREDQAAGGLLTALKIVPLTLSGGQLVPMTDSDLGCAIGAASVAGGTKIPRAFDVSYTLRSRVTHQPYRFAQRFYCQINPQ